MKKLLALSLAVMLVLSFGFSTLAAGFVESPSNNAAPSVVEAKNETEDCTADIKVTSYADRNELSAEEKKDLEDMYKDISEVENIADLSNELKEFFEQNGIDTKDLAVSDLFDVNYIDCIPHETDEHGKFTITLSADTLENFVALVSYNDGKYTPVKDAKVSADGKHLTFTMDDLTPLAIVVDTSKATQKPTTGDDFNLTLWVTVLALSTVSLFAVSFIGYKRRKA